MERISVDFNTMMMDPEARVLLPTHMVPKILPALRPGLRVSLYDETLEVEAVVEQDDRYRDRWWARPDVSTYRDLPYLADTDR
ncbi:MAG: hypothetical protein ACR2K6_09570 [Solirubrobacterales bacterium]